MTNSLGAQIPYLERQAIMTLVRDMTVGAGIDPDETPEITPQAKLELAAELGQDALTLAQVAYASRCWRECCMDISSP
jgi:hypothetical protein